MVEVAKTQRAYTLRIRGVDKTDNSWRDALWATHEAVNKGAKVFGDWLLTLRGGLDHKLANEGGPKELANRRILLALSWLSVESAPKEGEAVQKFVIATGKDLKKKRDQAVQAALNEVLQQCAKYDEAPSVEINEWWEHCKLSLEVPIREDAVWINRNKCFQAAQSIVGPALTSDAVWDVLTPVFGSAKKMFEPVSLDEDRAKKGSQRATKARRKEEADDAESGQPNTSEKKDFVKKAGAWLSLRYKAEGGADFETIASRYELILKSIRQVSTSVTGEQLIVNISNSLQTEGGARGIIASLAYPGWTPKGPFFDRFRSLEPDKQYSSQALYPLLQATEKLAAKVLAQSKLRSANPKGPTPLSVSILNAVSNRRNGCGFSYSQKKRLDSVSDPSTDNVSKTKEGANHHEYSVMLDHAMRRVSISHSWIKRAEASRAKFESDKQRIERVPARVRDWLDRLAVDCATKTNSAELYYIRKRALGGKDAKAWKSVVEAWLSEDCVSERDRELAVSSVQSDWDEDEKFGHPDLFLNLAKDDARCVWQDGPKALIDYVYAKDAEACMRRLKVPAYRHPDPCLHPIFCEFGSSRWSVDYESHVAPRRIAAALTDVEKKKSALTCVQSNGRDRSKKQTALMKAETRLEQARHCAIQNRNRITLKLWNGERFVNSDELSCGLTWHSTRLSKDLGINSPVSSSNLDLPVIQAVSRLDRLGIAAVGAASAKNLAIPNVFQEKEWNARLQIQRCDLDAHAKRIAEGKSARRFRWYVTFSPRFRPTGPWLEYASQHSISLDTGNDQGETFIRAIPDPKTRKKNEWRGIAYPFWRTENQEGRVGHAKILLSRLPGLRILSVDLGHRFAAACAVWQTMTANEVEDLCKAYGRHLPEYEELFIHLKKKVQRQKKGKSVQIDETVIVRRLESQNRSTESASCASWARLERQFVIKLPGEEVSPRAASDNLEIALVDRFVDRVELKIDTGKAYGRNVQELMSRTARVMSLALRRHGRRAKIAFALDPATRINYGIGGKQIEFEIGAATHIESLIDALFDWHSLASDSKWDDKTSRKLWNEYIAVENADWHLPEPSFDPNVIDERTRPQRKMADEELRARLTPIAAWLASLDRTTLHRCWKERWELDDGHERDTSDFLPRLLRNEVGKVIGSATSAKRDTSGFHADIRWLTDWIMGWHLPARPPKRGGGTWADFPSRGSQL